MSSAQGSTEMNYAARKALEGHRLLSAGDYTGAIAACTEAIKLEPGSIGAKRTLQEANRQQYLATLDPQKRVQELLADFLGWT